MKKYFLFVNGANAGPYSFEELRMMNISSATPVWFEGLGNWSTAGQIPELQSLFYVNPQPQSYYGQQQSGYIPPAYGSPQNYSQPAPVYPAPSSGSSTGKILIIVGSIFVVLIGAAVYFIHTVKERQRHAMQEVDSILQAQAAADAVQATDYSAYVGDYYNYSGGKLQISGTSNDNLEVVLHFESKTGTSCSGDITGTAYLNVGSKEIVVSTANGCELTLEESSNNDGFVVTESGDCGAYHGANCNFGGMYFKQ